MTKARVGIFFAVTLAMTSNAAAQAFNEDDLVTIDYSGNARNATAGGDINGAPLIASMGYGPGGLGWLNRVGCHGDVCLRGKP